MRFDGFETFFESVKNCKSFLGFFDFSRSDLKAASIPPSIGSDPQSPEGQAYL